MVEGQACKQARYRGEGTVVEEAGGAEIVVVVPTPRQSDTREN